LARSARIGKLEKHEELLTTLGTRDVKAATLDRYFHTVGSRKRVTLTAETKRSVAAHVTEVPIPGD
jgi:hypothetical protein